MFTMSLCHQEGMEGACNTVVGSELGGVWFPGLVSGGKKCELVGQNRLEVLEAEPC